MRIAYVLRYFPTRSETFVHREIARLQDRGHEIHVIALGRRGDGVTQDGIPDVPVHRPPTGRTSLSAVRGARMAMRSGFREGMRFAARNLPARSAVRVPWLAGLLVELRIERVHVHFAGEAAEWALAATRIADLPMSVTGHAVDLWKPRPALPEVLRAARPAIAISRDGAARIREVSGVDPTLIRCGVDADAFSEAAPDAGGPLQIVSVGRFVAKKGLDSLAAAVLRCPVPVHLRLVSDAPAGLQCERIATGPLPSSEIPRALSAAHLFALPCRVAADGDRDGVPVALIEAMATALPVLTTPVGGIPELVDERVGWLIPPDDPAALDEALVRIAADPAARRSRGLAGRARVRSDWTLDAQVDALLRAWA